MIGDNIRYNRILKGLRQDDLAHIIGVNRRTISDYENNKIEPNLRNLNKLAEFFGITLDELVNNNRGNKEVVL